MNEKSRGDKPHPEFYSRLIFSVLFWGLGAWWAISRRAGFNLGGDPDVSMRRVIVVDARGLDAVMLGLFAIALGILNLSLGIRGRHRLPVFWTGAALFVLTASYGVVMYVRALLR